MMGADAIRCRARAVEGGGGGAGSQDLTWTDHYGGAFSSLTSDDRVWTVDANNNWIKASSDLNPKSAGKWYAEVIALAGVGGGAAIGIAPVGISVAPGTGGSSNAGDGGRVQCFGNGNSREDGVYSSYGSPWVVGDRIGIAVDLSAASPSIRAYLNGVDQGVMYTLPSASWVLHACGYGAGVSFELPVDVLHRPDGYSIWT